MYYDINKELENTVEKDWYKAIKRFRVIQYNGLWEVTNNTNDEKRNIVGYILKKITGKGLLLNDSIETIDCSMEEHNINFNDVCYIGCVAYREDEYIINLLLEKNLEIEKNTVKKVKALVISVNWRDDNSNFFTDFHEDWEEDRLCYVEVTNNTDNELEIRSYAGTLHGYSEKLAKYKNKETGLIYYTWKNDTGIFDEYNYYTNGEREYISTKQHNRLITGRHALNTVYRRLTNR